MTALAGEMRELRGQNREKRPADYGLENALARKVRRENPSGTIDAVAATYGLTHGEAKGCVYGSASRTTLNKVLKRGGWALAVELMADVLGEPLDNFIQKQAERARHERARWEAEERAAEARAAAVVELRSWAGRSAQSARGRGQADAGMGGSAEGGS